MSTFLELAKDYAREARFSQLSAAITTTVGQTGRNLEAVEAVRNAYIDIQNRHTNWRWMQDEATLNTTAADGTYTYSDFSITRFKKWVIDPDYPWRIYKTSDGVANEQDLHFMDWPSFRQMFRRGTQVQQRPAFFSIDNQNQVQFGPIPDDDYTISGVYQKGNQILGTTGDETAKNAEVPEMPADYHNLIWAYALETYGFNHASANILQRAGMLKKMRMMQLEGVELPEIPIAGPMA